MVKRRRSPRLALRPTPLLGLMEVPEAEVPAVERTARGVEPVTESAGAITEREAVMPAGTISHGPRSSTLDATGIQEAAVSGEALPMTSPADVHSLPSNPSAAGLDNPDSETNTERVTDQVTESTVEPMQELAQLALDAEATDTGATRQRAPPPIPPPVSTPAEGRRTRSSTAKFYKQLAASRRAVEDKDALLAAAIEKEEEREVLGQSVSGSSDEESDGSRFEDDGGNGRSALSRLFDISDGSDESANEAEDSDEVFERRPAKSVKTKHQQSALQGRASSVSKNKRAHRSSTPSVKKGAGPRAKQRSVDTETNPNAVSNLMALRWGQDSRSSPDASVCETPSSRGSGSTRSVVNVGALSTNGDVSDEEFELGSDAIQEDGQFALGLQTEFDTWADFEYGMSEFQEDTFQLFKKRTSKSVAEFNSKPRKCDLPEEFVTYSRTFKCTHGMKPQFKPTESEKDTSKLGETDSASKNGKKAKKSKSTPPQAGTQVRQRRHLRYTGCKATINATVVPRTLDPKSTKVSVLQKKSKPDPNAFCIRWTSSGFHNHIVSQQLYSYYAENRLPKTPALIQDVQRLMKSGGSAQGMLHLLREERATPIKIRDIHNLIAKIKMERVAGTTVEDRLQTNFRSFANADRGNWATVFVDKGTKEAQSIVFQSARMRRLFAAFPEVVMVDATHNTNRNKYALFSFVVHDLFGKGQYVNHSMLRRETMNNMEDTVKEFKKFNERWNDIRAFIVDKDFKERTVLRSNFPNARILLCVYHAIAYLAKKIKGLVRGTQLQKEELIHVCRALVYAKSRVVYDALKLVLARYLEQTMVEEDEEQESDNESERDVFSEDPSEDEGDEDDEVEVEDDDLVASIQELASRDAREDDCVRRGRKHRFFRYFLKNWESCKDEWVLYLRQNVAHLGNHTNNRVEAKWGQMKRVTTAKMDMEEAVRTIRAMQSASEDEYLEELTKIGTRMAYTNDEELNHLRSFVSDHAYNLVSAEYHAVQEKRVQYTIKDSEDGLNVVLTSATGNEDATEHTVALKEFQCSCLFAQVRLLPCRHVMFYRKFKSCEEVIPFRYINKRWNLLNPANNISIGDALTGRLTIKTACVKKSDKMAHGDKFCKAMGALKPIASVIASKPPATFDKMLAFVEKLGVALASGQIPSFPDSDSEDGVNDGGEDALDPGTEEEAAKSHDDTQDWEVEEDSVLGVREPSDSPHFVLPVVVNNFRARRDLKKVGMLAVREKVMKHARKYMTSVVQEQGSTFTLADVEAKLVMSNYSYKTAMPVVCRVSILSTSTPSKVVPKRDEHVISDSSAVRYILTDTELDRLRRQVNEADIDAEEATDVCRVVQVGDGMGYLSLAQLCVMERFMDALARVNAVIVATEWLKSRETTANEVEVPFNDHGVSLDEAYIQKAVAACESMPLGYVSTPLDEVLGCDVLEIASDNWLHTTSALAVLASVWCIVDGVGVIRPEFMGMVEKEQRQRTIRANGAFDEDTHTIIAIINLDESHWVAFLINKTESVCWLYDPLKDGCEDRIRRLKKIVQADVAPHLPHRLNYRTCTELYQGDNNSCGVYCGVFLELKLQNEKWDEHKWHSSTLFRVRYILTVAMMLTQLSKNSTMI